jgi:hypothetical protein
MLAPKLPPPARRKSKPRRQTDYGQPRITTASFKLLLAVKTCAVRSLAWSYRPRDWAGATQCRLTILQAAPQVDDNGQVSWTGTIVNPRNGSTYNIILRVNAAHQLLLRGYLGLPIFGETQTWSPYNGSLAENCRLNQPVG